MSTLNNYLNYLQESENLEGTSFSLLKLKSMIKDFQGSIDDPKRMKGLVNKFKHLEQKPNVIEKHIRQIAEKANISKEEVEHARTSILKALSAFLLVSHTIVSPLAWFLVGMSIFLAISKGMSLFEAVNSITTQLSKGMKEVNSDETGVFGTSFQLGKECFYIGLGIVGAILLTPYFAASVGVIFMLYILLGVWSFFALLTFYIGLFRSAYQEDK